MSPGIANRLAAVAVTTTVAATLSTGLAAADPSGFANGPQCGQGSSAIVLLETTLSYAMICRFDGDGHTYYRGTGKRSGQSVETSDVRTSAHYGAYVARSNGYQYILQHEGLRVLAPSGNQISFEPAVYTYP